MKCLKNIHPGKVLLEDFLKPLGISQYRLAIACAQPPKNKKPLEFIEFQGFEIGSGDRI